MKKEKQKILELFAKGDYEKLKDHILISLGKLREKTIAMLESFIYEVDGKVRLKLLEILMMDGGPDLISMFIEAIRREKNLLYTKSHILLYREFKHQEALTALLSIENEIQPDLKATYQRALGRLLSRFSEQFYMSEFRAGHGNLRRVKFAVDMMLRSPHPDYLPFFNEQILVNDFGYRQEGVRALKALGDYTSEEALFSLLTKLRSQRRRTHDLMALLQGGDRAVESCLRSLHDGAEMNWDEDRMYAHLERVKQGEISDTLDEILDEYSLTPDVRRKIRPYLEELLQGEEPTAFEDSRVNTVMSDFSETLEALMKQTSKTLGTVAAREADESFLDRMEAYLPLDETGRDNLLIASLSGYRSPESKDMLIDYINTCNEPSLLADSLEALRDYNCEEVPGGIEKLCFDEKHNILRQKALSLLSKWGRGETIVNRLLECESISMRADGIRIAAEFEMEPCYAGIVKILRPGTPDSLLIEALEALRAFDNPATGKVVKPFLLPPHTISVRKTALETIYFSGGEDRMELLHKTFEQNPIQSVHDIIEAFLNLLLEGDFTAAEDAVIVHRDFWLRLILEQSGDFRTKLISMVERLEIEQDILAKTWVQGLKKILNQFQGKTVTEDERRLSAIVATLEARMKLQQETTLRIKSMDGILDGLDARSPFQRIQSLRKLTQEYRPEMAEDRPAHMKKLLTMVSSIIDQGQDAGQELLLQAINAAGKIRHPKLFQTLQPLKDSHDSAIRLNVSKVLEIPVDPVFLKPIKSVFIMDDSRYITKQLSKVLAEAGYDVDFENSVDAGMECLRAKTFDLLILDLIMPKMDGITFLKKARGLDAAPEHCLVVTSTRNQEQLHPFFKCGIDGLLLKPFRMEAMLQRIKELSPV